jgi:hypothetical protein
MKNIQVIDDALNCSFDVFEATDEEFALLFPGAGRKSNSPKTSPICPHRRSFRGFEADLGALRSARETHGDPTAGHAMVLITTKDFSVRSERMELIPDA